MINPRCYAWEWWATPSWAQLIRRPGGPRHTSSTSLAIQSCVLSAVATREMFSAARRLGWQSTETDWRRLIERPDIDLVDVCTPGDTHAEIAIAALDAGKHVLCEKPMANSVAEAMAMVAAAERAAEHGVFAMVGFTYRRVPAVALAHQSVSEGRMGRSDMFGRSTYKTGSLIHRPR